MSSRRLRRSDTRVSSAAVDSVPDASSAASVARTSSSGGNAIEAK